LLGIPEVRALCARVRRPVKTLLVGGGLIVPALMSGWQPKLLTQQVAESTEATPVEEPDRVELAARSAVSAAWRAKVLERERERVSQEFAIEFRIALDLAHEIHLAALHEKVDPQIAFRLVRAESRFRPAAISPVGAMGLTQLMPATASWLVPGTSRRQLLDPRTNLRIGFRYFRQLLDQYGDARLALTAYNRGPGTVDRLLKEGDDPDNGYTDFVLTGDGAEHARSLANSQ
jgi:soluble lytic murein transglycosylase-like protein